MLKAGAPPEKRQITEYLPRSQAKKLPTVYLELPDNMRRLLLAPKREVSVQIARGG